MMANDLPSIPTSRRCRLPLLGLCLLLPIAAIAETNVIWTAEDGSWDVVRGQHDGGWLPTGGAFDEDGFRFLVIGLKLPPDFCLTHLGGDVVLIFQRGAQQRLVQDEGLATINTKRKEVKDSRWTKTVFRLRDDPLKGRLRMAVRVPSWRGCQGWTLVGLRPSWEVKKCQQD